MAKFAYNNTKNTSTSHISFELNCGYYFQVFYKKNIKPRSKLKSVDKLLEELQKLMTICYKNLYHT